MKLIINLYLIVLVLAVDNLHALDIDEKLTCRFLKISNSKKTVLINRGAEDGLVVGDHAKFFITSGIIARGLVEKVSPSRSIWSIYRIVANDEMIENKVLNLKIASPVKVTNDPTKSLKDENTLEGLDKISIPAGADAEISPSATSDADISELDEMKTPIEKMEKSSKKIETKSLEKNEVSINSEPELVVTNSTKMWEIFGNGSMNSMSGTLSSETTTSTSSAASVFDVSVGVEKYFFNSSMLKDWSLFGVLYKRSMEEGDRYKTSTDWLQYGAGVNYHFLNSVTKNNKMIGFVNGSFGLGTTSIKEKVVTGSSADETAVSGTNSFFSLGAGVKYFVGDLGFRALFDYNIIKETFTYDTGAISSRSLGGPRIQMGLSYRFY